MAIKKYLKWLKRKGVNKYSGFGKYWVVNDLTNKKVLFNCHGHNINPFDNHYHDLFKK